MIGKYKITGMKAEGYNIVGAMLNNNVVYSSNSEELTCLEYTIVPENDTDKVFFYAYNHPYLPSFDQSNNDDDAAYKQVKSIEIYKKDGTKKIYSKVQHVVELACEVEKINIKFSKLTKFIEMPSRLGTVLEIDTSGLESMGGMFEGCYLITSLDVTGWDVSNVTAMNGMFYNCQSLKTINGIKEWDVSKVTNMRAMFSDSGITNINLSSWNTSNVTNMSDMFSCCRSLTSVNMANCDTRNVTDMYSMFSSCSSLASLDVSNWSTGNVTNMAMMFIECENLKAIDLSKWNTSKVSNMSCMFTHCRRLGSLDLSNFDTRNVTDASDMFFNLGYPYHEGTIDWNYNGSNYTNWTLTESETWYKDTFPWNQ